MVQRSASARRATASARTAPPRPKGVVTAIVAVTGVEDEVGDIITPGIFAATLKRRRPKVVFHHDFRDFAGRIVQIEEWMPGDRRLPAQQPNGQPWPAAAGALVATMQFNMNTERGREVYEWARFYAETGEAAWSIGYTVPPGMAAKRGNVRVIYGIDLFEVSLVLHGAHPMTMALEVKAAAGLVAGARAMETKATPVNTLPNPGADAGVHNTGVMVALYPPRDLAERLAVPGGEPVDELHITLAFLGDSAEASFTAEDLAAALRPAVANLQPLSGQLGGLGLFPDSGDGAPAWVPVDVPGLEALREAVATAADQVTGGAVRRDHGYTPHLTLGYDLPKVDPVEPTPVSFDRVTVVFADQRVDVPIGPQAAPQTPPAIETKAGSALVASARTAPTLPATMETKTMPTMNGSYEERRDLVTDAVTHELRPKKAKKGDGDPSSPADCWVSVDATFDDHVIASVHTHDQQPDSWRVEYTIEGDKVRLGKRTQVDLELVAVPDGETAPSPQAALIVAPAVRQIESVTQAIAAAPLEFKALTDLRPTVMGLLDALTEKGLDVDDLLYGDPERTPEAPLPEDDEDDDEPRPSAPGAPAVETKAAVDDEDPAPAERGDSPLPASPDDADDTDPDDDEDDDERVSVDREDIEAELAALRA